MTRNVYILLEEPERKRRLGRPGRRWDDNIKTDVKAIWCEGVDWILLIQMGFGGGLLWTR